VQIIGVPMDLGQQRRGVDMGASAVRYAGLTSAIRNLDYQVLDSGNLAVPIAEQLDENDADGRVHNLISVSQACRDLYGSMCAALAHNDIAITLGGDHSLALGSIAGALEQPAPLGVLWVDAHADFNTPITTPSGNIHGMVVAALMGHCPPPLTVGNTRLRPEQIVMVATRDLDPGERDRLREHNVCVYTMSEIDKKGMAYIVAAAFERLADAQVLHVSFDMDSLDPAVASGVGTPVPGGLSYREAHLLMEMLADDGRVRSLDVVEVNPILDIENQTAEMAVELIASLLGKRIL
jgi:arginase